MAWLVIGYNDPTLLQDLYKLKVMADTVRINRPRLVAGITFPEEYLPAFFMAIGEDPNKVEVERFETDLENYQFILLHGQTTVDCEIPEYLPMLGRVARRFKKPITYMVEGQTGRKIQPDGILVVESNDRRAEVKTCHVSGREFSLRFSKPNPGRVSFADGDGLVFVEVSPNTVHLLVRISDIQNIPDGMKFLEGILYKTIAAAIDPATQDYINQLAAKEEKRQQELRRLAEEERRKEEERQRKEEEARKVREEEAARLEQAERREKLLKVGAEKREQYIKASRSRRKDDTRGLDEMIEKNRVEFDKNQARLVDIGWKREALKYRLQSIRKELEQVNSDSEEIYSGLAVHPQVAYLVPNQDNSDFIVVTKPLPENDENGKMWCISLSGQAPRIWEKNGTIFGGEKKELNLCNYPDIFAPAINFFASGDYYSVALLLINWLKENQNGNTRGEGTGTH
ncbi:MAG: hypothetical protein UV19_C0012G0003 [Parcubacteria group bacterium GW2011_GWA2_42_28]|nr:MAG: hypothetical protein UV19_C0012G0003 [Parcubacteria group bacterium GW2011_GWA2_42_28]